MLLQLQSMVVSISVLQVTNKKGGQRESDLERIQDLFPDDCLRLHDADALTMVSTGRYLLLPPFSFIIYR